MEALIVTATLLFVGSAFLHGIFWVSAHNEKINRARLARANMNKKQTVRSQYRRRWK